MGLLLNTACPLLGLDSSLGHSPNAVASSCVGHVLTNGPVPSNCSQSMGSRNASFVAGAMKSRDGAFVASLGSREGARLIS